MLRVKNLEVSINFYTHILGMRLLRRQDYNEAQFTLAFLGYDNEEHSTVLELTYNWGDITYDKGNAFGHIALAVSDIHQAYEQLLAQNVTFTRTPGPMRFDQRETIAFIKDPDGYTIELIERA